MQKHASPLYNLSVGPYVCAGSYTVRLVFNLVLCLNFHDCFNPLYTGNPLTSTLANREDPDEMLHNAAFHQGLHCLLRLKQSSMKEIQF